MEGAESSFYASRIVNSVFNAFSSYTAVMLNILTIHAMRKTSSLPKTLKTLLLSLAVSDLGVGLLVQPFHVALLVKDPQPNTSDNLVYNSASIVHNFIVRFVSYASFFSVTALSVDRFLAVHLHLRYQELVTHKRVVAGVVIIWVFSVFLSVMRLFWAEIVGVVVAFILGFCFISLTVFYCKIYFTVRRHANQIQVLQVQQVSHDCEMAVNAAKLRKSAVSTFYVYLVFLFCYFSQYCVFVAYMSISKPNATLILFKMYTWTLVCLNSSLNPVVYCWKMRQVRHAIKDILRNIHLRQN